ncbi:hypothetical protein H0H93_016136, partial [Arthromyces matolae]
MRLALVLVTTALALGAPINERAVIEPEKGYLASRSLGVITATGQDYTVTERALDSESTSNVGGRTQAAASVDGATTQQEHPALHQLTSTPNLPLHRTRRTSGQNPPPTLHRLKSTLHLPLPQPDTSPQNAGPTPHRPTRQQIPVQLVYPEPSQSRPLRRVPNTSDNLRVVNFPIAEGKDGHGEALSSGRLAFKPHQRPQPPINEQSFEDAQPES